MGRKQQIMDLSGERYGRLTVLRLSHRVKCVNYWECACDCGAVSIVSASNLRAGHVRSCGCFRRQRITKINATHGMSHTPEHRTWASMNSRCTNPKDPSFPRYGGRGISVCERWQSFENFIEDMGGARPAGTTIDRIDNDGNYEPGNCRWATVKQQSNNRRSNVLLTIDGETRTISAWAEAKGLSLCLVWQRYKRHKWPVQDLFLPPSLTRREWRRHI